MSVNVTFNGASYKVPVKGDLNWGTYTTAYLVALGTYAPSKASQNIYTAYQIIANTGGLVMQAPGGAYYAITVDDNGVIGTTLVTI